VPGSAYLVGECGRYSELGVDGQDQLHPPVGGGR
jgi:hypothetical protein